ncbi:MULTISPECIES: hypothetical protein [unclassified Pseudomonas]|uniref:hypothetical protein n=1 Tax=unclassified Pseudomonas TaxID=196821 RepID=UPI0011B7A6FC|nr:MULTISPECIES: hypothetical protein [unclassified Pseudomonas]
MPVFKAVLKALRFNRLQRFDSGRGPLMAIRRQNDGKVLPLGKMPRQLNVAALLAADKRQGWGKSGY